MKILVIRFSSIGDIVLTSPVLRWLAQIDGSEIHFLTKPQFANLVESNPHVQQVHTLFESLKETISELNSNHFDIVIDLHKNYRSNKIAKALDVQILTFNKVNILKWLFVNFKINKLPKKHIVHRYAEAVTSLNVDTNDKSIDFFFPKDYTFKLAEHSLIERDYICIVIGGTYYTKQIPTSVIIDTIKRLNKYTVLLGGGESDGKKAEEIMAQVVNNTTNLVNKISLTDSAFVIQKSAGIITSDTGLMHIASAFDIPIHTLWGNTHPDFGMYAHRKYNTQIHNYLLNLPCQPCSKLGSKKCPRGHFDCMLKQNVEELVKNCGSEQ
ncbi:glycosyltransferase family 9 protein [Bacteroidia bacterium]|nr:glycosyltransferase family 9 protein [Bacteroidia bacterium]